ncbi:MAG: MaoC family dehydratase N-terminal domain-containing protein [Sciscionella sp.]|nr:MaoC family dehydratase N-terminal domain-containing protein [Sciscionella sp.]
MALDHSIVGVRRGPWTRTWTADDALLYAIAVGAGQVDPTRELAYTTENSTGVAQVALPGYAIVLAQFGGPQRALPGVDYTKLLHAEQSLRLSRALPVAGAVELHSTVTDIYDKGSGALVAVEYVASQPDGGAELFRTRSSVFLRGEGGFGGDRGLSTASPIPDRPADVTLRFATAVNQALLYRLTGDRNPLHSDPAFAARAGFDRPILHGLASYGITIRLLVNEFCSGDPSKVSFVDGRFTKPVFPGDELTVQAWTIDDGVAFRTSTPAGVAIDRGRFECR